MNCPHGREGFCPHCHPNIAPLGLKLKLDGREDASMWLAPQEPAPERILLHRTQFERDNGWHVCIDQVHGCGDKPPIVEHLMVLSAAAYDALKRDKDATQEKYRAYRDQIDVLQRDLAAAREREAPLCAPHARLYKKNLSGFFRGACYACAVNARAELEAPDAD